METFLLSETCSLSIPVLLLFTANYVAAAWARWLTELLASGLLANGALQDQRRAAVSRGRLQTHHLSAVGCSVSQWNALGVLTEQLYQSHRPFALHPCQRLHCRSR